MAHAYEVVLGLSGLLAFAVLLLPVARRLNFPYTVLLAAVGCGLGLAVSVAPEHGILGDFLTASASLGVTSETVLFIFLPALVFESALSIDVRRLLADIGPILFLAVLGLLISTFMVGFAMNAASGLPLLVCLLLGAIVSATDPVAVVAIFKDLGAPKRLGILVEGESLFNDATAIVMFTLLAALIIEGGDVSVADGTLSFLKVFIGGVVVGVVMARALCWLLARVDNQALVQTTLTVSLAYLSFVVAEHYLHVSGVMAVVSAALVIGSRGRTILSPSAWHILHETWEIIGFWANSLIFLLVGLIVPGLLAGAGMQELTWLAILLAVAFVARAVIIYGLLPVMTGLKLAGQVSSAFKTVMFWGGLRGAVSLALALAVLENPGYSEEVKDFIGIMVTGFVLFTLFVNAPSMSALMSMLGLNKLSATDTAIRNRVRVLALDHLISKLRKTQDQQDIDESLADGVIKPYETQMHAAEEELAQLTGLGANAWMQVGLTALIARERKLVMSHYANGFVSPNITRQRLAQVESHSDALKLRGVDGYVDALERSLLGFPRSFRMALWVQRRLHRSHYLGALLADRFESLLANRLVLQQLREHSLAQMAPLLGKEASQGLDRLLSHRQTLLDQALGGLRGQYPDYARTLETRYLERVALRLEERDYASMLDESLMTQEVHAALTAQLGERKQKLDRRPELDLGLDPVKLIAQVPFFQGLSEQRLATIAALMQPELALPGECVVRKGAPGDCMYFISSGSLKVALPDQDIVLGSGDFFGEMALINHAPRSADVSALGYCDLLALYSRDFHALIEGDDELKDIIRAVASERSSGHAVTAEEAAPQWNRLGAIPDIDD